jgi:hypothetical protein
MRVSGLRRNPSGRHAGILWREFDVDRELIELRASMPQRPAFVIDFLRHEVHEAAAMLLSLLAYPSDDEEETARGRMHASLCAYVLRARYGDDDITPRPMKPVHAFRDLKTIENDLRNLDRRLQDRMAAGRMALAYLKEAAGGSMPKLPRGIKRLSLNQLSEMVLADTRESAPENVEVRVWRASLPVIHLAAAVLVLSYLSVRSGRRLKLLDLLTDRTLLEWIVRAAQEYEPLPQRSRRKIDPAGLIKICFAS